MQSTIKEYILLRGWDMYIFLKRQWRKKMRATKKLKDFVRDLADEAMKELEQDIEIHRGQK